MSSAPVDQARTDGRVDQAAGGQLVDRQLLGDRADRDLGFTAARGDRRRRAWITDGPADGGRVSADARSDLAQRHAEVDAALRGPNAVASAAAAVVGVALHADYGTGFTAWAAAPALYWLVGLVRLRAWLGIASWNIGSIGVTAAAVAGTAAASGGVTSPTLVFAPLTGVVAFALYPRSPLAIVVGPLTLGAVAASDVIAGRWPLSLIAVAAFGIASVLLPMLSARLVSIELEHRRRAVVDPLTGCLNRHALDDRVAELEELSRISNGPIAVIAIDIDHFKAVNDGHGHAAGDRVLAHIAYTMRTSLRRFELLYRLGGEEFLLVLPGADVQAARHVADQLRIAIARSNVAGITVTASLGVASARPPVDIAALIATADKRLYDAKNGGRNTVAA